MVYAPELYPSNFTNPFAPTYNPNDFGDGTNPFVENYKEAKKYENYKASNQVKIVSDSKKD